MWETLDVSQRVYTGVLLQYAHYQYLYLLVYYSIQRHTYRTPKLIFEVLHILRVAHLDYPSHHCLCFLSQDELATHFCETAKVWGGLQNFTTTDFAKGPQIFIMVMICVLTPWSHYNIITEPCAHFLFSRLEGLSIEFLSHMIVSIIDIYQDTTTRDKINIIIDRLSLCQLITPLKAKVANWHVELKIPSAKNTQYVQNI